MTQLARRGFLRGLGVALAAPAIIRTPGLLMPVRPVLAAPMPPISIPSQGYRVGDLVFDQDGVLHYVNGAFYRFPSVY